MGHKGVLISGLHDFQGWEVIIANMKQNGRFPLISCILIEEALAFKVYATVLMWLFIALIMLTSW